MDGRSIGGDPAILVATSAASPVVDLGVDGPTDSGHPRPGSQDTIPPGQPSPPAPWSGDASADASCARDPLAFSQTEGG
eukprot:4180003-Pyramimonas_sp.AAC.1